MSAPLRPIREIRRRLLAQPSITAKPVCGACGREVQPRDFGREHCKACEAERAAVSEAWEAERYAEANPGAAFPLPSELMFGSDEAAKPFLPDDEDGDAQRQAEDLF